MRFVLAGSSGFLGTALRDRLAQEGHDVVRLVRGPAATPSESSWDPYAGQVDEVVVGGADVVINLAGSPIGRWPWTRDYRRSILRSRVATTATLARAVAAANPPRPTWRAPASPATATTAARSCSTSRRPTAPGSWPTWHGPGRTQPALRRLRALESVTSAAAWCWVPGAARSG
ncbi:MAG: NAD-dependent epimerase/dehydratase family protein [Nocardioidaceae bacterium]